MAKSRSASKIVWFFIILLFVLAALVLLLPVYKNLRGRQQELRRQQELLSAGRARLMKKQKEVNDLENSPEAVELFSREKYHMVRSDETILYYETPDKTKKR